MKIFKKLSIITACILLAVFCLSFAACAGDLPEGGNGTDGGDEPPHTENALIAEMQVGGGVIKIELYPQYAPNTVANFVKLVGEGFYDGQIFHRVIKDFMIQGGDPTGTGGGGSGYQIEGEFIKNGFTQNTLKHTRGVISMARGDGFNTAGSQFFIVHKTSPHLDGLYAAFGRVISGMQYVDAIAETAVDEYDRPLAEQKIIKVKMI